MSCRKFLVFSLLLAPLSAAAQRGVVSSRVPALGAVPVRTAPQIRRFSAPVSPNFRIDTFQYRDVPRLQLQDEREHRALAAVEPLRSSLAPAKVSRMPATRASTILGGVFDGLGRAPKAAVSGAFNRVSPKGKKAPEAPWVSYNGARFRRWMFSDEIRISDQLVKAIDRTQETLDIAVYSFRFPKVVSAIERAIERGVRVRMVFDERHAFPRNVEPALADIFGGGVSEQILAILRNPNVESRILRGLGRYGSMHNKFAIFDGKMFMTGSYNWNANADTANFENTIWRSDADRVELQRQYFDWLFENGYEYVEGDPQGSPDNLSTPPEDQSRSVKFKRWWFPKAAFSPGGRAAWWVKKAIRSSEKTIEVAMFSFYDGEIADELILAKKRGVRVRVLADKSQASRNSQIPKLIENDVEVRFLNGHSPSGWDRMHNKWARFDGELIETGSYNWSFTGDQNSFENANFINDAEELAGYGHKFEGMWAVGERPEDRFDPSGIDVDPYQADFGLPIQPRSDEDLGAGEPR